MLSDKEKQNLLQASLYLRYDLKQETPKPQSITVEEVFADRVIYNIDGQLYETTYEMVDDEPRFGDPVKVTSTKIFTREALQETYSEIIQEVGKRNAVKDAARVKRILEICQELLSSEVPDKEKSKEALKEATKELAWIKSLEAVKTEENMEFPSSAFAYVPDKENASTWKLRMWEDLEKKTTKSQLGKLAASLSPGGRSGVKVTIPEADLGAVKRKIRSAYRALEVDDADIPRWVQEAQTRELSHSFTPLTEASAVDGKGRASIVVIRPGFNATEDRYYPAEMLKRDFGIFEGQKMYADHPTEDEDQARPERSIRDWVATLTEVKVDDDGVVTGLAIVHEGWLKAKLAALQEGGTLSEMGVSINAVGSASKGQIDGKDTLIIERLVSARSVDFVTEPGAGGGVTIYESDRNRDIDLVELSVLRERRPDLVSMVEARVRNEIAKEGKSVMEDKERISELEGQVGTLTTENDGLKATAAQEAAERAKAEAKATIKEAVEKAELPQASKDVLMARFENAETADGIEEAIKSEIDYVAKLSEAGKVKGFGPSQPDIEKGQAALRESWKAAHPEWTDEQLETAVTGR